MSDALLSPSVALTAGAAAVGLLAWAGTEIKKKDSPGIVPLMGIMGAFVFAAQMVNFSIPGTGSSGHIVGGVLLAAFLGPWAAFITLASVLIIQCLVFSDGGLLALGCNIINMGAATCLLAYPLVFRPIAGKSVSPLRLSGAAVAACVVGLEIGALLVTLETELSGITALDTGRFLALMTGIHLPIGLGEGLATAAILAFVAKSRPDLLLHPASGPSGTDRRSVRKAVIWFAVAAVVTAGGLVWLASSRPDGLEWSIASLTGSEELAVQTPSAMARGAQAVVEATAVMPDYGSPLSGVLGAAMVLLVVWAVSSMLLRPGRRMSVAGKTSGKER